MSVISKSPKPTLDDVMRREVALIAKACQQRLKHPDERDPLPYWIDGSASWEWVIECFLQDHSYDDVAIYAATPELAAEVIRQLAAIRRQVCLSLLEMDQDQAVYALSRLGSTPTNPAEPSIPFEPSNHIGPWRIMEGTAHDSYDNHVKAPPRNTI